MELYCLHYDVNEKIKNNLLIRRSFLLVEYSSCYFASRILSAHSFLWREFNDISKKKTQRLYRTGGRGENVHQHLTSGRTKHRA